MSNSASANGGATLFFTIFTLTRLPMATARRVLQRLLAANVDAHAGVKLQRLAAGRRLGIAEHHADFFTQLIGENAGRLGLVREWP